MPKCLKKILLPVFQFFFRLFPLQDKVVFRNFNGRGLGDDPKYIALEMLRLYPKIKLVWLASNLGESHPKGIKFIQFNSIRAYYHLATAKVWVNNIKHSSMFIPKRKNQFYIQTWHSTFGIKRIEAAANLPDSYVSRAMQDAAQTDLMYANNDYRMNIYRTGFWYKGPVIKSDVPRNSILFQLSENKKQEIRSFFSIPQNSSIVLYAPTFREDKSNASIYRFDYKKILCALEKKFQKKFTMLLKLHPNVARQQNALAFSKEVINACDYPDMQELLAIVDILITDFSASMFDFGFLRKPVFLFAQDYDRYVQKERDLDIDINDLPFSMSKSEIGLTNQIIAFEKEEYIEKIHHFYTRYGLKDAGNGAKTIAGIIYAQIAFPKKLY